MLVRVDKWEDRKETWFRDYSCVQYSSIRPWERFWEIRSHHCCRMGQADSYLGRWERRRSLNLQGASKERTEKVSQVILIFIMIHKFQTRILKISSSMGQTYKVIVIMMMWCLWHSAGLISWSTLVAMMGLWLLGIWKPAMSNSIYTTMIPHACLKEATTSRSQSLLTVYERLVINMLIALDLLQEENVGFSVRRLALEILGLWDYRN